MTAPRNSFPSAPDALLQDVASFLESPPSVEEAVLQDALACLLDSLGNAMLALQISSCSQWVGPMVSGTTLPFGARLPGTPLELDPSTAAFDLALCSRWLGLHCLWPGEECVSPADPVAPLFCAADWLGRNLWHTGQAKAYGRPIRGRGAPPTMRDLLCHLVGAQEIQGALAEANEWSELGLDRGVLARVASASVIASLMGATRSQIISAASLAWQAGVSPALCERRSAWNAAEDARAAVALALRAMTGDEGCPAVLSMPKTGFQDACHGGRSLRINHAPGSSVSAQIVFNLSHPDPLPAQSAVEAALKLHPQYAGHPGQIEGVEIHTHAAGLALENGEGADRRRSLVHAVAEALVHGRLGAGQLEAEASPAVREIVSKTRISEDPAFTADSRDPDKRALPNAVQLRLAGGAHSERVVVEYPIGHYRRRREGLPLLLAKAESAISGRLDGDRAEDILDLFDHPAKLHAMTVVQFADLWVG